MQIVLHLHSNLVIFEYEYSFVVIKKIEKFTFQSGDIRITQMRYSIEVLNAFTFQSGDIRI